ncbi:QWRF motif-containing protein 3-like [Melia azedarach]|uniref:QWRF motif-containing protein 3-like n=1 Tax=Melia azedarach TaxID=155640 RepID=A0ACC1Z351_MELAZ|nr:QWRF motif-containing protein 3-like [Melia azedarach]
MKGVNETVLTDQSLKTRRPKSREVSSRFLSPNSTSSRDTGIPSPNQPQSPLRAGKPSTPPDIRMHRSLEESSASFIRGLWPSSTTSSSNKNLGTLAEHLGNERLRDYLDRKNESTKENHRPILGGSMRYTGKLRFPGKSSSSSSSSSNSLPHNSGIVPGRLSVDENSLYRKSYPRQSDYFMDNLESESECSDICSSNTDGNSPAISKGFSQSFRKSGIEVSSKYLLDVSTRPRRMNSDSNIQNHPVSLDSSPRPKKFTIKNAIKRANSLTGYGTATSQWALSPGRSGSPPMSVESKQRTISFSSFKPPTSPSRAKGMEKLLHFGLDLFKSKKNSSSPLGSGDIETAHQLRLLHNRLLQWRYANARADAVNGKIINQVEKNLLCAWESLKKLQHSVLKKKLQLQKEKLQMKVDFMLKSQIKPLESWGDMDRQHLSAISMTKDCLHSVVCRVPLIEGAKVDPQAASIAIRHASDIAASIKSMLASFSPSAESTVSLLSELAETVTQERLLMEECLELSRTISMLEVKSKTYIINMN